MANDTDESLISGDGRGHLNSDGEMNSGGYAIEDIEATRTMHNVVEAIESATNPVPATNTDDPQSISV